MNDHEVVDLTADQFAQWDALVDCSDHGTVFHKSGWLDVCGRAFGLKVKIFGYFQNGQLIGGCSLFIDRKWGLFSLANSCCSTTPYGGFVLLPPPGTSLHKHESFSRKIIESLLQAIEKEHYITTHIKNSPEFLDVRPFTLNGYRSRVWYAYYINLKNYNETNLDSSAKRHIRNAQKNRIFVEPCSDIVRYYELFCSTYTRKNMQPPGSERFFTEIYSFIRKRDCGEMIAARTPDGDITAAEIVVWDTRQAFSWTAVSDARYLSSGASTFLMNEHLNMLKGRGIPKINIMMANVPALSSFAASFNPVLIPHYQLRQHITLKFPI